MSAIVDLQGFKTKFNKFIPKEIAILYGNQVQVYLLKPPFPYNELNELEKKQVNWIQINRKVLWNEGVIPYVAIKNCIDFLEDKKIFVKGYEKTAWMKELLESNHNVYNLENYDCPSLQDLEIKYKKTNIFSCIYHSNVCALKNVFLLNEWCIDNKVF